MLPWFFAFLKFKLTVKKKKEKQAKIEKMLNIWGSKMELVGWGGSG